VADAVSSAAKVCTSLVTSSRRTAADTVLRLKAGGRRRCRKSSTRNRRAVAPRRKCSGASNPTADRTAAEQDTKERHGNCWWTNCRKSAGCMDRVVERKSRRETVGMCLSSVCRSRMMSLASSALYTQTQ